ncbi:unnamed protein product [Vitrella brassicaformis CCMP3155]|uniref:Dehydrogenase/reductase SDR family member 4 n=2 Tax=Vitrella brassicaformis TaxID=1169539 RepID=A0A0G4EGB9_VITBC|nr:unnamed protein product [Vitrella brassicaformis CCMP3155]|eukprot:CEL94503.1 unnamed protein product [Vitrella brassicaformis CCMP3155]
MQTNSACNCSRFRRKLAIVTASTAGIGYVIARRLAQEGADVVISSRKAKNVDEAVVALQREGLSVRGVACHVAKREDRQRLVQAAVEWKGRIDVLVSNAAASTAMGSVLDTDETAYDKMMETNLKSSFFLIQDAVPHLADGASILFVSSYLAFQPADPIAIYGVTKTALLGLTKALAHQLGERGIRVNCIAPGVVKTRFSSALWEEDSTADISIQRTFLKRLAEADDIAGPAAFLCSCDAAYVTGECLVVAGGMQSRL